MATRATENNSEPGAGSGQGGSSDIDETPPQYVFQWIEGVAYELIRGALYFSAHPDDNYTQETIVKFPERYYFSNDLSGSCGPRTPAPSIASPAHCDTFCCREPRRVVLLAEASHRWDRPPLHILPGDSVTVT